MYVTIFVANAFFHIQEEEEEEEDESNKESAAATGPDFNYLLNMPLWYLTKEKKDELCKQRDNKVRSFLFL